MAVKVRNVSKQVLIAFNDNNERVTIRPGEVAEISNKSFQALLGKVVKETAKKKTEEAKK